MPLETATYVTDLVPSNPPASDQVSQADDHIRLLKSCVKNTFPNLSAPITCTPANLNERSNDQRVCGIKDGTSLAPSLFFDSDPTCGLYRHANEQVGVAGRIRGNGTKEPGEICIFPFVPAQMASAGSAVGTEKYIEMDGSSYAMSLFPDIANLFPNNGSAFTVPNVKDTGRFLRSRTGSLAVGVAQANALKSHNHTATGSAAVTGAHTHSATPTVTVTDPGHRHDGGDLFDASSLGAFQPGGSGSAVTVVNNTAGSTFTGSAATGISVGVSIAVSTTGDHTHDISVTVNNSGDTETRPEALAVVMCVKT
jgi:hypothetical protein